MTPDQIEKLESALRMMKERRHEVAGLGAAILLIRDVLGHFETDCWYYKSDACDCGSPEKCMYKMPIP